MTTRPVIKRDPPLVLHNGITEEEFLKRFPSAYCVFALTPWEADRLGLNPDVVWWQFLRDFVYNSDKFGRVTMKRGVITDFGSIPPGLRGIMDDNSVTMLFGSAPHDKTFSDQGKIDSGRVLTFTECNELLREAQYYCGAGAVERWAVFRALQFGGGFAWRKAGKDIASRTANGTQRPTIKAPVIENDPD